MARKFEDRELDEYANIIISEVDRLQALVDRMLGPRESLDKRSINIHEVTERVRQLIEAEALDSVKVIRDYDPQPARIFGRLRSVDSGHPQHRSERLRSRRGRLSNHHQNTQQTSVHTQRAAP